MKYGPSLERDGRHQGTEGRLHGASPLLLNSAFVINVVRISPSETTKAKRSCKQRST